jgi:molecular chaperone HscB
MIECPSCGRRQKPQLTCEQCGAPLGAELDCFAALGLPQKLTIDLPALERLYHDLSRRVHPDRFASATPKVRSASLRATALLTRSYRTLKDPVARGLYWLELKGQKLAENNKQVPPDLAELVFDVQEQLAELTAERSGELEATINERRAEVGEAMNDAQENLAKNFATWDAGSGDEQKLVADLKNILSRIAYLRTLLRDIDRALENANAA